MFNNTEQTQIYKDKGGNRMVCGATAEIDFESGAKQTAAGTQASVGPAITDSTGGTGSTTFAAITAGASYAQADMTAVKNAISEIAAKLNAIISALQGVGISS